MSENNMKESGFEHLYPMIISEARDGIIMINEKGIICLWNKAATRIFGYTEDEVLGKNLHKLLTPSRFHEDHNKAFANYIKTGEGAALEKNVELFGIHKEGTEIPIELSFSSFQIKGQWHAVGFIRDITKKNQILNDLKNSEQRYQSLVDNFALGVSVISPDMEVLSINKQMKNWFNLTDDDIVDKPKCYKAFNNPPRDEICDYCPTCKTLIDGEIHESTTSTPVGDEIRNYRVISTPLKNHDGDIVAAIESVEDITEKMLAEKELNKIDKLESLAVLAGGIAHDFKNMLTSLMGNIALAKDKTKDMEKVQRCLVNAENACLRAKDLTAQLMTFAKGDSSIKKVDSIVNLIYETVSFSTAGSKLDVIYEINDELKKVNIDKSQIAQVINNLIINASQAMPKGGILRIKAENITLKFDNIYNLAEGEYVGISVADQGAGIPKENINRIFDPFFTTKEKGNGLGLASCHSIIKNHKGHLFVESKVGQGSTFTIYLPIADDNLIPENNESVEVNINAVSVLF